MTTSCSSAIPSSRAATATKAVDLLRQLARPRRQALENAIKDGCAKNSCSTRVPTPARPRRFPPPARGTASNSSREQDRSTRASSTGSPCTPNNWADPRSRPDGDQRWAYIILTGYGRTFPCRVNNDWLPVEGLLRVYVTGWDERATSATARNDPPPRGYDDKGAQLWGHLVEPITIDPAVIVGDGQCDLTNDNIQCSPRLVR